MRVTVNGKDTAVPDGSTLIKLLAQLSLAESRLAVELNHMIVPRSQHATQALQEGDAIEIVHAIGGG